MSEGYELSRSGADKAWQDRYGNENKKKKEEPVKKEKKKRKKEITIPKPDYHEPLEKDKELTDKEIEVGKRFLKQIIKDLEK